MGQNTRSYIFDNVVNSFFSIDTDKFLLQICSLQVQVEITPDDMTWVIFSDSSRAAEKQFSQAESYWTWLVNSFLRVKHPLSGWKHGLNLKIHTWQLSWHLFLRSNLTFATTLAAIIVPPLNHCNFNILNYKSNTPAGQYCRVWMFESHSG